VPAAGAQMKVGQQYPGTSGHVHHL
jgi:hypothetical protein